MWRSKQWTFSMGRWGRKHTNWQDEPADHRLGSDTDAMNKDSHRFTFGLWDQETWGNSPALSRQLREQMRSFFLHELGICCVYFKGFFTRIKDHAQGVLPQCLAQSKVSKCYPLFPEIKWLLLSGLPCVCVCVHARVCVRMWIYTNVNILFQMCL